MPAWLLRCAERFADRHWRRRFGGREAADELRVDCWEKLQLEFVRRDNTVRKMYCTRSLREG